MKFKILSKQTCDVFSNENLAEMWAVCSHMNIFASISETRKLLTQHVWAVKSDVNSISDECAVFPILYETSLSST